MTAPVLADGVPKRTGDRFVQTHSAMRTYTSPLGGKLRGTCDCQIEFIPCAPGTEIVETHNHAVSGMSKGRRQRMETQSGMQTKEHLGKRSNGAAWRWEWRLTPSHSPPRPRPVPADGTLGADAEVVPNDPGGTSVYGP